MSYVVNYKHKFHYYLYIILSFCCRSAVYLSDLKKREVPSSIDLLL